MWPLGRRLRRRLILLPLGHRPAARPRAWSAAPSHDVEAPMERRLLRFVRRAGLLARPPAKRVAGRPPSSRQDYAAKCVKNSAASAHGLPASCDLGAERVQGCCPSAPCAWLTLVARALSLGGARINRLAVPRNGAARDRMPAVHEPICAVRRAGEGHGATD